VPDPARRGESGLGAFAPQWGHLNAPASAASHITPVTMNGNRSRGICRVAWTTPWSGQRLSRVWRGPLPVDM